MITIEKIYVSKISGLINVDLYNDDVITDPYATTIVDIKARIITNGLDASYTIDPVVLAATLAAAPTTDEYKLLIDATTMLPDDPNSEPFTADGVFELILISSADLVSIVYVNTDIFYSYKLNLIATKKCIFEDFDMEKALTTFAFLEQMLLNSAELGYIEDAELYYQKMLNISSNKNIYQPSYYM
jgi:hypothetical protein